MSPFVWSCALLANVLSELNSSSAVEHAAVRSQKNGPMHSLQCNDGMPMIRTERCLNIGCRLSTMTEKGDQNDDRDRHA
jgi:hypothetical protein